jgi:hypothetical protein
MKVVLFCGGYGMRMRNSSDDPCRNRCRWSDRDRSSGM